MIDITKPLELEDGTPAFYVKPGSSYGRLVIDVPSRPYSSYNHTERLYNADGTHNLHQLPNLRNKIMSAPNFKKPLTVNGRDAKVIHTFDNGNVAVIVDGWSEVQTYRPDNNFAGLTNKIVETIQFVNVYPGERSMIHSTEDAARAGRGTARRADACCIKQTLIDGKVVKSELINIG